MALSEEEQRLLAQLEASLIQDDPKLANTMRTSAPRKIHGRQAALDGVGFIVGLAMLLVGMNIHPILSIIGFVLMLAGTVVALGAWKRVDEANEPARSRPTVPSGGDNQAFMNRMEDRWRRRQEGGM